MEMFRGQPVRLDTYLEPAVRYSIMAVAVPAMVVLWWFQLWWWVPVPALAGLLGHQLYFSRRADRPTELTIEAAEVALTDELRQTTETMDPRTVFVAMAYTRSLRGGRQLTLMLATDAGPALAVQIESQEFKVPAACFPVDVDEADRLLGGQAGVRNAVAPLDRGARQKFTDHRLLDALRAVVPVGAWPRTGVQLWRGIAPPLSPFGFHVAGADAWLVLDGSEWVLRQSGAELANGPLSRVTANSLERVVTLLIRTDDGPEETEASVPCLALTLAADLRIVFPAPVAAPNAPKAAPSERDYHCHAPEGAALVAHLRRVQSAEALPEALRSTRAPG